MRSNRFSSSTLFRALLVLTLTHAVLSQPAFAKKEPKTYPEVGKVNGIGTREAGGNSGGHFTHTYKVETESKINELDCGKAPLFPGTGGECGGDKKLKIGDDIRFRTQKQWVFLSVTQLDHGPEAFEQKLRILSEEVKPDSKPQDGARP